MTNGKENKYNITEAIHYNRDENSFTARLFERMAKRFESEPNYFREFIERIKDSTKCNYKITWQNLLYCDSMLFLENYDLYSYCINQIGEENTNLQNIKVDKTEFDFVIVAKDGNKNDILIVFEVKCFSNLDKEEIERQNKWLEIYKNAKLFNNYYHIALISYENFNRGSIIKQLGNINNFSIITWEDIKGFIEPNRIKDNIEFDKLYFKVKKNGERATKRHLINKINNN